VSPDGSTLAASADRGLSLSSTRGGTFLSTTLQRPPGAISLSISTDANLVALSGSAAPLPFEVRRRQADGDYEAVSIDRSFGTLARIDAGGDILRTFHPDGVGVDFYRVINGRPDFIHSWTTPVRTSVGAHTDDLSLMAIGPEQVSIIRNNALEAERQLASPTDPGVMLNALRFSPDARFLAASWQDGTSRIWSTETWDIVDMPALEDANVTVAFWSLDGSLAATTAADGLVTIRDGNTFEPIRTLAGNIGIGSVNNEDALLFSPDNQYLLTTVTGPSRLWDVESGQQIGEPFPNMDGVFPGANTGENGLQLITGSERGALIWNLNTDEWPAIACRAAGRELTEAEWQQWGPRDQPYRELCTSG